MTSSFTRPSPFFSLLSCPSLVPSFSAAHTQNLISILMVVAATAHLDDACIQRAHTQTQLFDWVSVGIIFLLSLPPRSSQY